MTAKMNLHASAVLYFARMAIEMARVRLDCCALETDEPEHNVVRAADYLDAAAQLLASASAKSRRAPG